MRKIVSVLLIIVFVFSFLTGCQSKKPEGVSQEFYDDMIHLTNIIVNTIKTDKLDYKLGSQYNEKTFKEKLLNYSTYKTLNEKEHQILDIGYNLINEIEFYIGSNKTFQSEFFYKLKEFGELINLDFNMKIE